MLTESQIINLMENWKAIDNCSYFRDKTGKYQPGYLFKKFDWVKENSNNMETLKRMFLLFYNLKLNDNLSLEKIDAFEISEKTQKESDFIAGFIE